MVVRHGYGGGVANQIRDDGGRRPRIAGSLLVTLLVLTVVVLGFLVTCWPTSRQSMPTTNRPLAEASGSSVVSPAPEASSNQSRALPPISGTTVDAVAAGWEKKWPEVPKLSPRGYDTKATLPGTEYRIRFGLLKSSVGEGSEVATLFCITTHERLTRDEQLIQGVVDSCLAPALTSAEEASMTTWLGSQDYSQDFSLSREFDRFDAELVSMHNIFQVRLLSKGRSY